MLMSQLKVEEFISVKINITDYFYFFNISEFVFWSDLFYSFGGKCFQRFVTIDSTNFFSLLINKSTS